MSLPETIARFDDAQHRTIALVRNVVSQLRPGLSSGDVVKLLREEARNHRFDRWFHEPVVRIGAAIGRSPALARLDRSTLQPGTLLSIDIGPADADSYGDLGITVSLPGAPVPEILAEGRALTQACCGYASRWKTMGEIYIFGQAWARNRCMELQNPNAIGHRILPKEGWLSTAFPRSALLSTHLRRNQLHRANATRMDGMFSVNPCLKQGELFVNFEEVIYIHEDTRRVLGRERYDEIGTL